MQYQPIRTIGVSSLLFLATAAVFSAGASGTQAEGSGSGLPIPPGIVSTAPSLVALIWLVVDNNKRHQRAEERRSMELEKRDAVIRQLHDENREAREATREVMTKMAMAMNEHTHSIERVLAMLKEKDLG